MPRAVQHQSSATRRAGCAAALALTFSTGAAWAGPDDAVLLPSVVPTVDAAGVPGFRRPDARLERALGYWATQLDVVLGEAVQDLGLTLDVSEGRTRGSTNLSEPELVERAKESWIISPRIEGLGDQLRIRIVAVAPGSAVLLVRVQDVEPEELEVRAMVMLRDLVQTGRHSPEDADESPSTTRRDPTVVVPARSAGRAVLALNSAVFGGYVGISLQRASGNTDPRLTYPLIALGAGVGLGATMIVADEWDVGLGDAWYLAAGAWWPLASGLLLAESYDVEPETDRYAYGVVGAVSGLGLATAALTFRGMGEGGAVLTHSGGALGLVLGGLTQLAYEGQTDVTPTRGMGYGAALGVLSFGAIATQQVQLPASRVLLIDLSASLGALTGAAAGSPLLLVEQDTEDAAQRTRERLWLAGIGAGLVAGGVIGYLLTDSWQREADANPERWALIPDLGIIGQSTTSTGRAVPAYGLGVRGRF